MKVCVLWSFKVFNNIFSAEYLSIRKSEAFTFPNPQILLIIVLLIPFHFQTQFFGKPRVIRVIGFDNQIILGSVFHFHVDWVVVFVRVECKDKDRTWGADSRNDNVYTFPTKALTLFQPSDRNIFHRLDLGNIIMNTFENKLTSVVTDNSVFVHSKEKIKVHICNLVFQKTVYRVRNRVL